MYDLDNKGCWFVIYHKLNMSSANPLILKWAKYFTPLKTVFLYYNIFFLKGTLLTGGLLTPGGGYVYKKVSVLLIWFRNSKNCMF